MAEGRVEGVAVGDAGVRLVGQRLDGQDLTLLGELIATGKLEPVIDRAYSLSEAGDAVRHVEEGHARGKVIIDADRAHETRRRCMRLRITLSSPLPAMWLCHADARQVSDLPRTLSKRGGL